MKREIKNYSVDAWEVLENGYIVYYRNGDYSYECKRDEQGKILTYKDSDGLIKKWTYDENYNLLTKTENGKLVIDNRPKTITIELTQEQLDKIRESGLL